MSGQKKKRAQPQETFRDMVASATVKKFGDFIRHEVNQMGMRVAQQQQDTLETLYCRILSLEELLLETVPGLTKDKLATRVAVIQDKSLGLETAEDAAIVGDRVRLEIRTKTKDQPEFAGASRLMLDNLGSGNTLGKELENAMLGMKTGERKEVPFGQDAQMTAELTISRLSRRPKKEEPPKVEAAQSSEENASVESKSAE